MCHVNLQEVPVPRPPRSPWRRFLRQPLKPKLSRSVVPSAKINLNRYWSKFEDVASQKLILLAPVRCPAVTNAHDDNAINDNLINEQREFGKMNF